MQPNANYIEGEPPKAIQKVPPSDVTVRTPTQLEKIEQELRAVGVTGYGLWMPESRYLPRVLHPDETIKGVAYGWQPGGMVMMVATTRRIVFLDKKPFYLRDDEVSYDSVRGVSYYHTLFVSTVVLHTQVQDYTVRTFNQGSIRQFIEYVERRSFEHKSDQDSSTDMIG